MCLIRHQTLDSLFYASCTMMMTMMTSCMMTCLSLSVTVSRSDIYYVIICIRNLQSYNLCDDCLFVHLFIWYCFCGALTVHTLPDDDQKDKFSFLSSLWQHSLLRHSFLKNALSTHSVCIYILLVLIPNFFTLQIWCSVFSVSPYLKKTRIKATAFCGR